MDKILIKQKDDANGVMVGANTEVFLNGERIKGATGVKFEVKAKEIAKVTIEMVGKVEIEGNFLLGSYEPVKVEDKK